MIISDKNKFIYFSNGKVASTSINNLLLPLQDSRLKGLAVEHLFGYSHVPPSLLRTFYRENEWEDYFKFTFVRNPFDWIISCYLYKYRLMYGHWLRKSIENPLFLFHLIKRYKIIKQNSKKTKFTLEDIKDIKKRLITSRVLYFEKTLYQSNYTHDLDGNILVNYIGKYESLLNDIEYIKKCINCEIGNLPYLNRNRKNKSYELTYDAFEYIKYCWKKDFILLQFSDVLPVNFNILK